MAKVVGVAQCKIYNLSSGKSLPEWLSDRKKRSLQRSDIDVRKRIELIQDFEMPGVSNCIRTSKDGQYILASGVYKPRIRCYDVNQLSMKFERCFDSEVIKFEILSDDYSKLVLLQCDRYVEFHAQYGRYFRMRIPKFGHDLAYHSPSCDLFIVGSGSDVYRLNLEQGKFLNPYETEASGLNVCAVNPVHHLFACGSVEGRVEAWDPRSRHRVGTLDCAFSAVTGDSNIKSVPSITALKFMDGFVMGVGTATGQALLYDIRSSKPFLVKDHMYDLPITNIEFHQGSEQVLSMDKKIIRIWDRNSGKPFTSIEPGTDLNDLCLVPNTGMFFVANEDKKILTYFIPTLGAAPKWCSFLDSLTEELEESSTDLTYDDYKFVTSRELDTLGLSHLIGTNLLRAYMHGYFMDARLYHKAKSIMEPFSHDEYRQKKIREKLEEQRSTTVIHKQLPKVNKLLAEKLMESEMEPNIQKKDSDPSLLKDDRFKALFENPEFQIDEQSDEYRLLHPLVSKLDKDKKKKWQRLMEQFEKVEDEEEGKCSSEENSDLSSSDDEQGWAKEMKRQHKLLGREKKMARRQEDDEATLQAVCYEIKGEQSNVSLNKLPRKQSKKLTLGDRLAKEGQNETFVKSRVANQGNKQMTFTSSREQKRQQNLKEKDEQHDQRKSFVRPAKNVAHKGQKRN